MLCLRVVPDSRLEQALDKAADYIANRQCPQRRLLLLPLR